MRVDGAAKGHLECTRISAYGEDMPTRFPCLVGPSVVALIGALAFVTGAVAALPAGMPPANAQPAEVAGQFLGQISELKSKTMLVACVGLPRDVPLGITFMGGAIVKGNVMVLES